MLPKSGLRSLLLVTIASAVCGSLAYGQAPFPTAVVQGPDGFSSDMAHTSSNSSVDVGTDGRLVASFLHTPARMTDPESMGGWAYSDDNGATWTSAVLPTDNTDNFGPVDIAYNPQNGNWYILGTTADFSGTAGGLLWVSTDNGVSFQQGANWMANDPAPAGAWYPKLAVDDNPSSPNYGNIYITAASNFAGVTTRVYRSTDGGQTFSAPVALDPLPGANNFGPTSPLVLNDGTLLIVGHGSTDLFCSRSTDGGQTFEAPVNMGIPGLPTNFGTATHFLSGTGQPAIAQNVENGTIYCAFVRPDSGVPDGGDIYLFYSGDGGSSWIFGASVNDFDPATGSVQWAPDLVAHPSGGLLLTYHSTHQARSSTFFRRHARTIVEGETAGSLSMSAAICAERDPSLLALRQDRTFDTFVRSNTYCGSDFDGAVPAGDGFVMTYTATNRRDPSVSFEFQPDVIAAQVPRTAPGPNLHAIDYRLLSAVPILLRGKCHRIALTIRNDGGTASRATCQVELDPSMPATLELLFDAPFANYVSPGGTAVDTEVPFSLLVDSAHDTKIPAKVIVTVTADDGTVSTNSFTLTTGFATPTLSAVMPGVPIAIPSNNLDGAVGSFEVVGLPDDTFLGDVVLQTHIPHTYTADLELTLFDNAGTPWTLVRSIGGDGDNFGSSCIAPAFFETSDLLPNIETGAAPFVGRFRPMGDLRSLRGRRMSDFNGTWHLRVRDLQAGDVGTIECASLQFIAYGAVSSANLNACGADSSRAGYMVTSQHDFNDNAIGPGECNLIRPIFWNASPYALTNVTATLESADPNVTVYGETLQFADVPPNGSVASLGSARVAVSPSAACPSTVNATLKVSSNEANFDIPLELVLGELVDSGFHVTTPGPIADNLTSSFNFDVPMSSDRILGVDVTLHAKHTFVGDLKVKLRAPNGLEAVLVNRRGSSNDNFGAECGRRLTFSETSRVPIGIDANWWVPIEGIYQPEESLNIFTGMDPVDAMGTWQLIFEDLASGDAGTLECATLILKYGVCNTEDTFRCDFSPIAMNLPVSGGNGNARLEPLECLEWNIPIYNSFPLPLTNLTVKLVPLAGFDPIVETATYPEIAPGAIAFPNAPFQVQTHGALDCSSSRSGAVFLLDATSDQGTSTEIYAMATGHGPDSSPATFANGTAIDIPDNDAMGITSSIDVSGVTGNLSDLRVNVRVTHPYIGDLKIWLRSPFGATVPLFLRRGGSSDNLGATCPASSDDLTFSMYATAQLPSGSASMPNPPVGEFAPEDTFLYFLNSSDSAINGTWQLLVADFANSDIGKLECWSIEIGTSECETLSSGYCGASPVVYQMASISIPGGNSCAEVSIPLGNLGEDVMTNVSATLSFANPELQVVSGPVLYADIPTFDVSPPAQPFRVQADAGWVCPEHVSGTMTITSDQGSFNVPVTMASGTELTFGTVSGAGLPMMIPDLGESTVSFNVAQPPAPLRTITVALGIAHDFLPDLDIKLIAPNGVECVIMNDRGSAEQTLGAGCAGNQAVFTDFASFGFDDLPIDESGNRLPQESLQERYAGMAPADVAGTWRLVVVDDAGGDIGTIQCAELRFSFGNCTDGDGPCPTPTPTPSQSPTPTATATATVTATITATATASPSNTAVPTPTDGSTLTPTASATPSQSPSATPSNTPVPTPTDGSTLTPSPSASPSPTLSVSPTPTAVGPTATPSPTVPPTERQPVIDLILNKTGTVPSGADRNADGTIDSADISG